MRNYRIVNIQEILLQKKGVAYNGEIGVFVSNQPQQMRLAQDVPVYVNAFSYMLVLRGEAELIMDERQYMLSAGMLCLILPLHLTNFVRISSDFRCIFLCIHKSFIDRMIAFQLRQRIVRGMDLHRNPVIVMEPTDSRLLCRCICDVRTQIQRESHAYRLEMIQNALIRFYLELDNILEREEPAAEGGEAQPRHVVVLKEFFSLLMNHYKKQHQVAFYAEAMHLSVSYLTAIIRRQTGKTVNTFIFELLYSEARNLLSSTDRSVQQISSELHFADQASFSKFFKRYSGMSPCQFRIASLKGE